MSRRKFVKKSALSAIALPVMGLMPERKRLGFEDGNDFPLHIFSKHLQFLDFHTAGQKAVELGFAGLDLTVRPGGHVLPETVEDVLPNALETIRNAGSSCTIITTAIESATNELDRKVLGTAAANGITHYRCNWYKYPEEGSMENAVDQFGKQLTGLSELNKELDIVGCYQNHAGTKIGASVWEVKRMLSGVLPNYFGVQFDIRHAMVEAGLSWENSVRLMLENMKTIVLKDFIWSKENGIWKVKNVPIGEGMVDFTTYFRLLKRHNIKVPAILHLEYDLGGAEHGKSIINVPEEVVYSAMKKDKSKLEELWKEA